MIYVKIQIGIIYQGIAVESGNLNGTVPLDDFPHLAPLLAKHPQPIPHAHRLSASKYVPGCSWLTLTAFDFLIPRTICLPQPVEQHAKSFGDVYCSFCVPEIHLAFDF